MVLNTPQFPQAPKVAPYGNIPSQSSNIDTLNQGWTIQDLSSTGGYAGSAPAPPLIRSGSAGYGSNNVGLLQDNSLNGGGYGGSISSRVVKVVEPAPYGNNIINGGGLSLTNTIKSVDSTYGDNSNYGAGSSSRIVAPAPYGNNIINGGGLSLTNTIKSVDSTYGDNSNYGAGSSSRIVLPAPLGNNIIKSVGSSYGSNARSFGPVPVQQTGSPYGIQSTREFTNLLHDDLDLSKCGPGKIF